MHGLEIGIGPRIRGVGVRRIGIAYGIEAVNGDMVCDVGLYGIWVGVGFRL